MSDFFSGSSNFGGGILVSLLSRISVAIETLALKIFEKISDKYSLFRKIIDEWYSSKQPIVKLEFSNLSGELSFKIVASEIFSFGIKPVKSSHFSFTVSSEMFCVCVIGFCVTNGFSF